MSLKLNSRRFASLAVAVAVGVSGAATVGAAPAMAQTTGTEVEAGTPIHVVNLDRTVVDPVTGDITFHFTDGTFVTLKAGVDGVDGTDGKDGVIGKDATIVDVATESNGDVKLTFSDGTVVTIPAAKDGVDGEDGKDGEDATVLSTATDANGNIVITFSDGSVLVVANGKDGNDGSDGQDGADGENGKDGENGANATIVDQIANDDGSITIVFSDGSEVTIPAPAKGATDELAQCLLSPKMLLLAAIPAAGAIANAVAPAIPRVVEDVRAQFNLPSLNPQFDQWLYNATKDIDAGLLISGATGLAVLSVLADDFCGDLDADDNADGDAVAEKPTGSSGLGSSEQSEKVDGDDDTAIDTETDADLEVEEDPELVNAG